MSIAAARRHAIRIDLPEASLTNRSVEITATPSKVTVRQLVVPLPGRTVTIIQGGVSVSTVIGGSGREALPVISIEVPLGTPIAAAGISGDYKIGNGIGAVSASVQEGRLSAERLPSPQLEVAGAGTISARWVDGTANLTIRGSGSIHIADGQVAMLDALVTGTGEIDFQGHAVAAKLAIAGAGTISVKSAAAILERTVTGIGSINIRDSR